MRLEPVYLVAPKPKQPSIPTRRAFLFAGIAFATGSTVGTACGYTLGRASVNAAVLGAGGVELPPSSGDADLDELRRLAIAAPIEELIDKRLNFLASRNRQYPKDVYLWFGIKRLCDAIAAVPDTPERRLLARLLLDLVENKNPPSSISFRDNLPTLRLLAK
jgi:hypothetical protein